jgi:endoglucanase
VSIRQRMATGPVWWRWLTAVIVALAGAATVAACSLPALVHSQQSSATTTSTVAPQLPLHTQGSNIVDAQGRQVRLTGINWFGLETGTYAPHGLWARNWQQMLDQIRGSGFNAIRLPYSNQLFAPSSVPTGIDYGLNPDLRGLNGLQVMDKIVRGAEQRGIMVVLDQHRPDSQGQSSLWYSGNLTDQQWQSDWVMLAQRYRNDPYVVGADLHNEPKGEATWGDGNPKTDWQMAAQKAGNAVLAANPNWLVLVEGIEQYNNDSYWWGGNLQGAATHPVQLSEPDKLVYSAHDYGPGVYNQNWFSAPNFPQNMPAIWDKEFGYLAKQHKAPVLVGEFGGNSVAPTTVEGTWQRALLNYMKQNDIGYTYWSWNPDSGDTGGVLNNDWTTVNMDKLKMLQTYQWPIGPAPQS